MIHSRMNNIAWDEEEDKLWLLLPSEFENLPEGLVLEGIMGETGIVGERDFDMDTRFGFTAWGIRESQCPTTWRSSVSSGQ